MSEYRLGSPVRGIIGVIVSVILLIYIPKIVLNTLEDPMWLSSFLSGIGIEFDASGLKEMLENFDTTGIQALLKRMIVSAIPLVILAFPYRFYQDGNKGKMYVGLIRSVYCIFRYVYILNFGDLTGLAALESDDVTISLDVVLLGALVLSIFLKAIRIPKIIAEYKDERDDYVDFHIVDGRWVNISRRKYKKLKKEKRRDEKRERKEEKAERKDRIRVANGRKSKRKDDNDEGDDR